MDVDRPALKKNNLRFEEKTYFQERVKLPGYMLNRIRRERGGVDRDTAVRPARKADSSPTEADKPGGSSTSPVPIARDSTRKHASNRESSAAGPFPAVMPMEKPTDRPLSASWARMWDRWNPHEDRANELYSNFKYTPLKGFSREPNVSRRDPTKVLKIDGTYYVWYTCRRTEAPPAGLGGATETVPATDWDLADVWYATSKDGFGWEERGPAVRRPAKPTRGWRSICTPDVLIFEGKYYLYFQAYSPTVGGQRWCPVMAAVADSPDGPWTLQGEPVLEPGPAGSWDNIKINDP
ncbi:MAG: hypothetical protein HQ582_29995, partial [Planctomycetes bacterium]|nr:hypothetical protein [Planctomycetota bacterium]